MCSAIAHRCLCLEKINCMTFLNRQGDAHGTLSSLADEEVPTIGFTVGSTPVFCQGCKGCKGLHVKLQVASRAEFKKMELDELDIDIGYI